MTATHTWPATPTRTEANAATRARTDPGYAAFWLLRIGFGVVPIIAGTDSYSIKLVDWWEYLWVGVTNSCATLVSAVGAVALALLAWNYERRPVRQQRS